MSEVIKTPNTKTSANKQTAVNSEQTETQITWDSLANDLHERETSWDDLSRLEYKEEGGFKEPKETEEKIEPVFLSKSELRKLNSSERSLYHTDPTLYTQFLQIKDKFDSDLKASLFIGDIKIQSDVTRQEAAENHSNDRQFRIKTHTMNQIADIYNTLGGLAVSTGLFAKSPKEIDQISHRFNIAKSEMPLEKEPSPLRGRMINNILRKIHLRRSNTDGDNTSINYSPQSLSLRTRNQTRISFLNAIINTHHPETLGDETLRSISKTIEKNIEQDQDYLANAARDVIEYSRNDNIERFVALQQEIGPAQPELNSALTEYYRAFGLNQPSEDKFRKKVLPLISNDLIGEKRLRVLDHAFDSNQKLDFAIETLLPRLTEENRATIDQQVGIYNRIISRDEDRATYEETLQNAEAEILPFLLRHLNTIGSQLTGRLVDEQLDLISNKDQHSLTKLQERIKYSDELLRLVDVEHTTDKYVLQERLVNTAFDRGYEPDFVDYLETSLFPRIESNDKSLGSWARGGIFFLRGEENLRDYDFECLTSKITPQNINFLLMQRRELPTSDASRLEQNRIDALAIENIVVPNHAFIHHEHPMTNNLLKAMVDYYDARGTIRADQTRQSLEAVSADCNSEVFGNLEEYVFDYKNYDKIIEGEVNDDERYSRTYDIPAIDVLRRLVDNTKSNELEIPKIPDEKWQKLMKSANIKLNPENGKMRADWNSVGELVKYTNNWLTKHQDQYGLDATTVATIAFTERAATFAMRNVSEKERTELPYDENFKEIVKLQELTGGYDKFNQAEFDRFWEGFRNIKMGNDAELKDHYWRLARRELVQAGKLARVYNAKGVSDAGMKLQSGNLLTELMSLMEPRREETLRSRVNQMVDRIM